MPFDNPHELPFGDLEILRAARSRISNKGSWMKCGYQKRKPFLSGGGTIRGGREPPTSTIRTGLSGD